MSEPAAAQHPGYMQDARGRLVPLAAIKPEHLLEDEIVRALHAKADELSELLRQFREKAFEDIEAFLALLGDKYGVTLGGDRGNLTLNRFDGSEIVQVSIGDTLDLGPELQVAKTLIDGCIQRWSKGASAELLAIVNNAFNIDKKGKINVTEVLKLRRINSDDGDWKKAMGAISDATRVVTSKRYLRLYRKRGSEAKKLLPLDLASA